MENGFHWLDTLVVVAYFVGITGYGMWLMRKVKNSDGYFRGSRKFNKWVMMAQGFGAGTWLMLLSFRDAFTQPAPLGESLLYERFPINMFCNVFMWKHLGMTNGFYNDLLPPF